ncbi:ArsR/SmtB family transcription factor [Notoacmeibacter ruber]|uniref:ArsR family transcriptional regulator n=1 Tax=Notoacmeibacter ruber TaxID=2670375 RepID=A0A3L7JF60_9HYPH|nr:metalloregulator ArsR/SmtB family transcription factor [Notoacmeibacter ruber]RLQ88221.1 ArsR family transcriptional regulator [Notoacmeibacter ruber]
MPLPKLSADTPKHLQSTYLENARRAADYLKALSHESRLIILCILSQGEKSVSELETILQMPQAGVSQQLARLRADALVGTRREGRMIFYSIADPATSKLIEHIYDMFCGDEPADAAEKSAAE